MCAQQVGGQGVTPRYYSLGVIQLDVETGSLTGNRGMLIRLSDWAANPRDSPDSVSPGAGMYSGVQLYSAYMYTGKQVFVW